MKNKYRFMVNQLQCQLEDVQTSKEQSSVHQELQNTELSALRKALNEVNNWYVLGFQSIFTPNQLQAEKKNQLLLDQINAEVRSRDDEKILEEIKEAQGDIRQCQKAIDWLFSVSETLGKSEIPSVELMLELRCEWLYWTCWYIYTMFNSF